MCRASPKGTNQGLSTLQWTHLCAVKLGKANSIGIWILNYYDVLLEEVYGTGETDPIGELGIFIYILQMHIEINVKY